MVFCLIPAKPHAQAKSRLAPVLTGPQRADLSRWLLRRTLRLAHQVIGPVVVVSRDPAILAQAETHGAWGLPEATAGLNPALTQAVSFAMDHGATGILVLPTDLPRITASDLETILSLGNVEGAGFQPALRTTSLLVIAPCRHGTGTNALLMHPPDLIPFLFGPDSFAAHCTAARAIGVEPIICRAEGIALDLDTPEDWELAIKGSRIRGIGE